jgi:PPOX class probable F420-dependent enzyme
MGGAFPAFPGTIDSRPAATPYPGTKPRVAPTGFRKATDEATVSRESLGRERYVNLATFRKSGKEVRTPVWIAADGDRLYVYTNRTMGKVKRIRNDGRVRIAPCDARGGVRGEWEDGQAQMLDDPGAIKRGLDAIILKYGWMMRAALIASRISGRYADRAVIEIDVPGNEPT